MKKKIFHKKLKLSYFLFNRAATAALVEKQSREMLELINEKRSEYMMAESLYLDDGDIEETALPYPSQAPIPAPPAISKFQIYNDPVEFAHVDQIAISVSGISSFLHLFCLSEAIFSPKTHKPLLSVLPREKTVCQTTTRLSTKDGSILVKVGPKPL